MSIRTRASAVVVSSFAAASPAAGCAPRFASPAPPRVVASVAEISGDAPAIRVVSERGHGAGDGGDNAGSGQTDETDDSDVAGDGADSDHVDGHAARARNLIRPCADGAERKAAEAAVDALGARIGALADADDPKTTAAELAALLATDCFALANRDPHDALTFDSGASLRTWWNDGGWEWVTHYLALDNRRVVVLPPSPRTSARRIVGPKHPLASLVCDGSDAACGRETTGWARRMDRGFELRTDARRAWEKSAEECEKEALAVKNETHRYMILRSCLDSATPRRMAMPLGRFKAPASGWLVVGTMRRCGELRAYDLATGAAYVAKETCAAHSGGVSVSIGRVPVVVLREAAWGILVGPLADRRVRTTSTAYDVPDAIPIEEPTNAPTSMSIRCGCGGVRSTRPWSWMRDRAGTFRGQASGVLRPGSSCDDAEDHAGELLQIVDDAFEEGCAPAPPPARVAWSEPGEAIGGRSPATLDDPATEPLRDALALARRKVCPK